MRRWLGLGVSLGLVGALWLAIDVRAVGAMLGQASGGRLSLAILALATPLALSAWRFGWIARVGFADAARMTMAAQTLNLILPAKAGDMAKAAFMARMGGGRMRLSGAFGVVAYEKFSDLAALLTLGAVAGLAMAMIGDPLFLLIAVALTPVAAMLSAALASDRAARRVLRIVPVRFAYLACRVFAGWRRARRAVTARRGGVARLAAVSLAIWALHMVQIWLLGRALAPDLGFGVTAALAPIGVVAGLAPIAIAGVGPRDLAFAGLFAPVIGAPAAAAFGALTTLRYIAPALAGAPFAVSRLAQLRLAP